MHFFVILFVYYKYYSYLCSVKQEKRAGLTCRDKEKDKVQVFFRKQESLTCFHRDFEIATQIPYTLFREQPFTDI